MFYQIQLLPTYRARLVYLFNPRTPRRCDRTWMPPWLQAIRFQSTPPLQSVTLGRVRPLPFLKNKYIPYQSSLLDSIYATMSILERTFKYHPRTTSTTASGRSIDMANLKQAYIKEIIKLLEKCNDLDLLDLIFKILLKSH